MMRDNSIMEQDEYKRNGMSVCCQFALEIEKLKKQDVFFYFFRLPVVQDLRNPSDFEKKIIRENIKGDNVLEMLSEQEFESISHEPFKEDYIDGIFRSFQPIVRKNGVLVHGDSEHVYFHVKDGMRVTVGKKSGCSKTIHLFGKSQCFGIGVRDDQTIASYLQSKCRQEYCVENHGVGGVSYQEILLHVQNGNFRKGDIVVVIQHIEDFMDQYFKVLGATIDNQLFELLSRPHSMGEIFYDRYHFNDIASEKISEYINHVIFHTIGIHRIQMQKVLQDIKNLPALTVTEEPLFLAELNEYIDQIKSNIGVIDGRVGAIVMNCNPFTLGHRYLVECALKQADHLILFVVEENSSFFSFQERYEMVKRGCADLSQVSVVPSGQFIISANTFPQYFEKDKLKEVNIDPSFDVDIFGKYIAPAFGIKVRFVGNEPFDFITNQYNETMIRILPQYGICCVVIERKKSEEQTISASLVRTYIKEDSLDKIKMLVPNTTLAYCENKIKDYLQEEE